MENMSGSMNEKMVSQEHDTERTINRKDNKAKNEALTYIRDYRVMTNRKYRLITNILIPFLAIFTSMLIACSKTIWAWIGVIVIVYDFYMMCEVVQDYFCFGCMCKKNAFGMHFLKAGFNGVRYFENAVLVDILIRPLRIGITILIASIPFIKFGVNIWSIFDIIMISSIVSVGSLNIFRYMDMGMYIYLLALIVIFPAIAGSIAVLIYGGRMWFIAPVLAVVLVGVIAATYYHMMMRIRRSYFDVQRYFKLEVYLKRRNIMLKDIKLGFKLLRYGYKLKLNVIMLVFFAVIGIASDIMSKGTTIIGGIYFMMSGMFTFQLIMSMDVSELIQSTSLKKKLQIYIPVMSSTVINLVIFTFLVVERVILIQYGVADKTQLIYTLFTLDVALFIVYLYTSICYKYFVLGFIVFMVLFMGVFTVFSGAAFVPVSNAVFKLGLPVVALLGYIAIFAGGALEILIGELLYKKPLSEFAFRGFFRDAK